MGPCTCLNNRVEQPIALCHVNVYSSSRLSSPNWKTCAAGCLRPSRNASGTSGAARSPPLAAMPVRVLHLGISLRQLLRPARGFELQPRAELGAGTRPSCYSSRKSQLATPTFFRSSAYFRRNEALFRDLFGGF